MSKLKIGTLVKVTGAWGAPEWNGHIGLVIDTPSGCKWGENPKGHQWVLFFDPPIRKPAQEGIPSAAYCPEVEALTIIKEPDDEQV
jgi:hypothetical protein